MKNESSEFIECMSAKRIGTFLAKKGVSYPILLGGKDVSKDYYVSGYPTVYLLDKNGKILYTMEGYGTGAEAILENNILKIL